MHGHCNIPLSALIFECILPEAAESVVESINDDVDTNNNIDNIASNSRDSNTITVAAESSPTAIISVSNKNKKQKISSTSTTSTSITTGKKNSKSTTKKQQAQDQSTVTAVTSANGIKFTSNLSLWIFCQRLSHMKLLSSRNSNMPLTAQQESLLQQLVDEGGVDRT